jgi:hypothetical protein
LSRTPGGVTRPAPLQGEHSLEVFRELLAMTEDEYAALVAAEISGVGPALRVEAPDERSTASPTLGASPAPI